MRKKQNEKKRPQSFCHAPKSNFRTSKNSKNSQDAEKQSLSQQNIKEPFVVRTNGMIGYKVEQEPVEEDFDDEE
ncbi:MAG: hypothetical protein KKE23_02070 [Nanoarchaeota archaeon]|nr:hypothetical protein [Nanoarchaeota archaeon]